MSIHSRPTLSSVPPALLSPFDKGLGALEGSIATVQVASLGWNLLREDISLPAAVLSEEKLRHNAEWMQAFIQAYGVKLAPHGKTTMAPQLFALQLATGAWGITLATAQQVAVAYAHGVRRVLMANQLIGRANMAIIAELLADASFEYYCLVDSAAQVAQLHAYFSARGLRLNVLLELGVAGGRCGVRDEQQLRSVLAALEHAKGSMQLCGLEVYEGVLKGEPQVRAFLENAVDVASTLLREQRFARKPALLSGAGSAWYDVVAEVFSAAGLGDAVEVILRPGCYLTHDVGSYRAAQNDISERNPVARAMHTGLEPALRVWASVQSIPESGLAVIALGKRDAAFDAGLPTPALHYHPGAAVPTDAPEHWRLTKMMDQHAYLEITEGDSLQVGDMIGFDISHPCLTFDKWRALLVVDAAYNVVNVVQTYF